MVSSLWRYSHFVLALVSALFIVVASITGAILALEPIAEVSQSYSVETLEEIPLSKTVTIVQANYDEVLELEITEEDFVTASVITKSGDSKKIYINPIDGSELGIVSSQSPFFSFVKNLHRSLFLKTIGRVFVGIVSILLCFIAVTGVLLLIKRQGGIKRWFTAIQEKEVTQRYHVILGRWFLLPIIIIAVTGVYLSAEKFSLLPETSVDHNWSAISSTSLEEKQVSEFSLFQSLSLNDVRKITFPFSEDSEDYFELALYDKELLIDQYTGEVMSEVSYPFVKLALRWGMILHTGQGSILWSVILLISSLSLLFFIYSGFAMSLKRLKKTRSISSQWSKDEAEYIILVGSETGSTYAFAKAFFSSLINNKSRVHMSTLNQYSTYDNGKYLIVFTSTYGEGDAPSNARKFKKLFNEIEQVNEMQFSVLGFGSLAYPNYCRFAINVDALLHSDNSCTPVLPLMKVNEESTVEFSKWVNTWNDMTSMGLKPKLPKETVEKEQFFEVLQRTSLNVDNTVLVRLKPKRRMYFQSGDLLNIIPPGDSRVRQYSIAKIGANILLSIKLHHKGICSNYLCGLNVGNVISAHIERNENFHFPRRASLVWLIANGTGIAPYLGMLSENQRTPVQLTWGGKIALSFNGYKEILEQTLSRKQKIEYQLALSQEENKEYVQDVLSKQEEEVSQTLKNGGVFMICGSLAMQHSVLDTLEKITTKQLQQPLSDFENNGQLLMDCY